MGFEDATRTTLAPRMSGLGQKRHGKDDVRRGPCAQLLPRPLLKVLPPLWRVERAVVGPVAHHALDVVGQYQELLRSGRTRPVQVQKLMVLVCGDTLQVFREWVLEHVDVQRVPRGEPRLFLEVESTGDGVHPYWVFLEVLL